MMKRYMAKPLLTITLLVAIFGGIYFGLFSCGGYAWHKQYFLTVLFGNLILFLVLPPYSGMAVCARILAISAIVVLFVVTEALAATFYPASPTSWTDFVQGFWFHLANGPC